MGSSLSSCASLTVPQLVLECACRYSTKIYIRLFSIIYQKPWRFKSFDRWDEHITRLLRSNKDALYNVNNSFVRKQSAVRVHQKWFFDTLKEGAQPLTIHQMARNFLAIPTISAPSLALFSKPSNLPPKNWITISSEKGFYVLCLRDKGRNWYWWRESD